MLNTVEHRIPNTDEPTDIHLYKDDVLSTIQENDIYIMPSIKLIRDEIEDTLSTQRNPCNLTLEHFYDEDEIEIDPSGTVRNIEYKPIYMNLHHDSGANRSVTNDLSLLHDVEEITNPYTIQGANANSGFLSCTHKGMFNLKCDDDSYIQVPVYYSANVDGTIISPTEICMHNAQRYHIWEKTCDIKKGTGTLKFHSNNNTFEQAVITLTMNNGLWYSQQNRRWKPIHTDKGYVKTLTADAAYELWHQRLGHPGHKIMQYMHQCTQGLPDMSQSKPQFYHCKSCDHGKITKKDRRKQTNTKIFSRGQRFHMDFGFVRAHDNDTNHKNKHNFTTSIDGFNSYLIIVDAFSRFTWIFLTSSKEPPLDILKDFLQDHGLQRGDRTIRTDQGGELYRSLRFRKMAHLAGYKVEPTGSDDSAQNGVAERPNRTFGNMMRTVLFNSGLPSTFWSYALRHCAYIKNRVPHSHFNFEKTPYESYTGRIPDLSHLRVFGCPVVARKAGKRRSKLSQHSFSGIFLEFVNNSSNIRYYDTKSKRIKIASHVTFDEAHFTSKNAPPGAVALQKVGMSSALRDETISKELKHTISIPFRKISTKATSPVIATDGAVGADLFSAIDITIKPGALVTVPTDIAIDCPKGFYARVAPRSGMTVKHHIDVMAGVIDNDYRGNVLVALHNFGTESHSVKTGDKIAQLVFERISYPTFNEKTRLSHTQRNDRGFGSTDKISVINSFCTESLSSLDKSSEVSHEIIVPFYTVDTKAKVTKMKVQENVIELCNDFSGPTTTVSISIKGHHPTAGLMLNEDNYLNQITLHHCERSTPAAHIRKWRSTLRNAILHQINNNNVKTKQDVIDIIKNTRAENNKSINLTFITQQRVPIHTQKGTPALYLDQIDQITETLNSLRTSSDINLPDNQTILQAMVELETESQENVLIPSPAIIQSVIRKIAQTSSKPKPKKLTRRHLRTLQEWHKWKDAEKTQLELYHSQNMFGAPIPCPRNANVLHMLWVYKIKDTGVYKARAVCNGSQKQKGTVTQDHTFAACLEQPGARIFWGTAATQGLIVLGADASNAFAEAPAPKAPLYVWVDDQYREWYQEKFNKEIPRGSVLPVQHALQGHPESPRLWSKLIDNVIQKHIGLKPTVHEPCLYSGKYNNETVFLLRQVDDFAIAAKSQETAKEIIEHISKYLSVPMHNLGILNKFNGVDILQTKDYIKISSKSYINKILSDYKWTTEESHPTINPTPMKDDPTYQNRLDTERGPHYKEDLKAFTDLETKMGFKYRKAIGELLFTMVTTRPDISYPVLKLSKFSNFPSEIHYLAIKTIFRYLRNTSEDGILFWRQKTLNTAELPDVPPPRLFHLKNPKLQQNPEEITAFVDANWAQDKNSRKSITGMAILYAGALVYYKTKYQSTISHSTTEAEFTAACDAAKSILYLRTILDQLGLDQSKATILFEDNQGALQMANAQQPTRRTRHMDIKHFAIQDWIEHDLIALHRVETSNNISDGFTKQLGRSLFHKHRDTLMGRRPPTYYVGKYSSSSTSLDM